MRKEAAIIAVLLLTSNDLLYCWQIWQGQVQPALMTWALFCVAVSISFATYWATPKHSLVGNIGNSVDLVGVWTILLTILLVGHEVRVGFNRLDLACLLGSLLILMYWRLTKRHASANMGIQVVMVIAYFPTLYRLWTATNNTESLVFWLVTWVGAVMTIIPAILDRDRLATIYASRALLLVTAVIILIVRLIV